MKLVGLRGLFSELKERRFAQFLGVYSAVAWGVLEVIDQLSQNEIFPPLVYRVALTLTLCGTPGVLVVTWFHGKRGDQQMPRLEKVLIGVVGLFALSASGFVVRSGLAPEDANARGVQLEEWEDPTRVAVLYFDAPAGEEDTEAIAAGLTEGLIDELSAVQALHVITRNGSELVRGSAMREDSIARTLGVGTLVRGQLRVAGEQMRLTVTMIEGSTGKQLETTRIDGPRGNVFELQDSLSAQMAIFLRERIGQEVKRVEERGGTKVVEAWELVQRAEQTAAGAQQLVADNNLHSALELIASADSLLEQAERLDPEWTLPITRRGWYAYRQARFYGAQQAPQVEPTARGLEHAERALAIDSLDADALELRGTLAYWRSLLNIVDHDEHHGVVDRAAADLKAATVHNPRAASALASLSHLYMNQGDVAQAKLVAGQSYEADPFLANANVTLWRLASTTWELGVRLESEKWCAEGQRRFPRDFRFRQCQLMLYGLKDYPPDIPKAWTVMREFVELAPTQLRPVTEKQGLMLMAMALVRASLPDSAHAVAVRGRAGPDLDPTQEIAWWETIFRTWLANFYKQRGQEDRANEQYAEAVRQLGIRLAANPPSLEGLQNDARAGQIDKWFLEGLPSRPEFRALIGVR